MKYCPECGNNIEDVRKFCPECGFNFSSQTKLEDTVPQEQILNIAEDKLEETVTTEPKGNIKWSKEKKITLVIGLFFILIIIIAIASQMGKNQPTYTPYSGPETITLYDNEPYTPGQSFKFILHYTGCEMYADFGAGSMSIKENGIWISSISSGDRIWLQADTTYEFIMPQYSGSLSATLTYEPMLHPMKPYIEKLN